jgi:DNA invertase Pin-like site-specific DNA recombinase
LHERRQARLHHGIVFVQRREHADAPYAVALLRPRHHRPRVVADNGVSGIATRLVERPEGRRLFDKLRAGDVLVVRWVDRLGRNYEDVCDAIREFMRRGVVIRTVINNFTFDGATKDPMR